MFKRLITFLFKKRLFNSIKEAERFQFYSLTSIHQKQEEKFLNLIRHARSHVPYYKDFLNDVQSLDDLSKIPFLTKNIIKKNNNDLKATNVEPKRFQTDATSGSTGESLYFYTDSKNLARKAVNIRGDSWAGMDYGSKGLYLWGAERDIIKSKSLYKKIKDLFFLKTKILSTYHMSDQDILSYINIYNKYKPSVLISYPTPLYRVAKFIEENKLEIYVPKGIITSAETLFPFQRGLIEKVFNCHVFNRFGCREFGHIASECEFHNGLHINVDNLIVEIIDTNGNLCRPGEMGEIVITDLYNYVFPFIRYKIGDLGTLSEKKCNCGRNLPLLENIEGRVFDLIIGTNGNVVGGTYWTLLKYKIKGWQKFQIVQESHGSLNIVIENNSEIEKDVTEKLTKIVMNKLGEDMKITINIVDHITETATGKHRWIISKISPYVK